MSSESLKVGDVARTAAQLDALPAWSVIVDTDEDVWQKHEDNLWHSTLAAAVEAWTSEDHFDAAGNGAVLVVFVPGDQPWHEAGAQ